MHNKGNKFADFCNFIEKNLCISKSCTFLATYSRDAGSVSGNRVDANGTNEKTINTYEYNTNSGRKTQLHENRTTHQSH